MSSPIYFDHNATTPIEPTVLAAMLPWLSEGFGNASSRHNHGRLARQAIDEARSKVAALIRADATEIIFTGGGSEANNLFIKGAASCMKPGLLAISAIEHPCVMRPAEQLMRRGWQMRRLQVDGDGRIDNLHYDLVMSERPKLVSVMHANNETGTLQDIESLATRAKASGACFHTDAVQSVGKIAVDFRHLNAAGVGALTFSAHKMGGPKGVAALIVDKRVELEALIAGGGQEKGLRSGTENVAGIIGFGVACELVRQRMVENAPRLNALRIRLEAGLSDLGITLFGSGSERLPNTVYFAVSDIDGETLVGELDRAGYAVASGAACSSANPDPSHVLRAMGVAPELARGAVRISLGADNSAKQIEDFLLTLRNTITKLKRLTAIAV